MASNIEARIEREAVARSRLTWEQYQDCSVMARYFLATRTTLKANDVLSMANQSRRQVGPGFFCLQFESADAAADAEPARWDFDASLRSQMAWPMPEPWTDRMPYVPLWLNNAKKVWRNADGPYVMPVHRSHCEQSTGCLVLTMIAARPKLQFQRNGSMLLTTWTGGFRHGTGLVTPSNGIALGYRCFGSPATQLLLDRGVMAFSFNEEEVSRLTSELDAYLASELQAGVEQRIHWGFTPALVLPREVLCRIHELREDIQAVPLARAQLEEQQRDVARQRLLRKRAEETQREEELAFLQQGGREAAICVHCGGMNSSWPYPCQRCRPSQPLKPLAPCSPSSHCLESVLVKASNECAALKKQLRKRPVANLKSFT